MLIHNLFLIYRNFKRFKSTFFINLVGLSTGLACVVLIFLWIADEFYVDTFHVHDKQLYQILENQHNDGGILTQPFTPDRLAEFLAAEMPEVEMAAGVTPGSYFGDFGLKAGSERQLKATGQFAGRDFFKIFSFNLVQGDAETILRDKNSVVISKKLAQSLFGSEEDALGKTLDWELLGRNNTATVSGVFEDVPAHSTLQFDFVLSYEAWLDLSKEMGRDIHWDNHGPFTYVVLGEGTDISGFNKKIENFLEEKQGADIGITLFATPYSGQYLYGTYENGEQAGGRISYVRLFAFIGVFILIIASINFMNLSTAKASGRIREVGVKKAIGADRKALVFQFLMESLVLAFASLGIALLMALLFLPAFNDITGKDLVLAFDYRVIGTLLLIAFFTGLLAGSYPAFYLSGFSPSMVLKGKVASSVNEVWVRKGLVVFQFALSVILIVAVLIIYSQIQFVQGKHLGYDRENVLVFQREGKVAENQEAFLAELKKIPGIVNASGTSGDLMGSKNNTYGLTWEGKDPAADIRFEHMSVDYGLVETLGIEMMEGRTFSNRFGDEQSKLVFNEAAVKIMGLDDPVGKTVNLWGEDYQIIGVAKDFHFESLHQEVRPFFFRLAPEQTLHIATKIAQGREQDVIAALEKLYNVFNPGYALDYRFLDASYQALYVAEQRVSSLSRYFAGLAILISCLGLFGLVAFSAERRIKEIGLRKVLGASELGIVKLLSGDFVKLVILAITIALPVSYFVVKNWLDNFAYKIDLEWWYFIGAGALTMLIALLTISFQSMKAALMNPVESLRTE